MFNRIRFLWHYDSLARDFIHTMKYRPSARLCRFAGRLLASVLPTLFEQLNWDLLVPLPSSYHSYRGRGFNQCVVMARALHNSMHRQAGQYGGNFPHLSFAALTHAQERAPQAKTPHRRRYSNVKNMFEASHECCADKRILLLDDVITTGATSTAAARALLAAGATQVDLLALARSDAWLEFRTQTF